MTRLPALTARDVTRKLKRAGLFLTGKQKGSRAYRGRIFGIVSSRVSVYLWKGSIHRIPVLGATIVVFLGSLKVKPKSHK